MNQRVSSDRRFRLSASEVARYFKFQCDRRFRWNAVPGDLQGEPGIGANMPALGRDRVRPGVHLLRTEGDRFEIECVQTLRREVRSHRESMAFRGIQEEKGRRQIQPLPTETFVELVLQDIRPRFFAQVELTFSSEARAHFLERFNLSQERVELRPAKLDLIEDVSEAGDPARLRVWEIKASESPKHEHYMQVAYYSFLLEHLLEERACGVAVDTTHGMIWSREGREPFELGPYRRAVGDFLQNEAASLLETSAQAAHYHVNRTCMLCEWVEVCQDEADRTGDLSRIAYITSESKRHLNETGITGCAELAKLAEERPPDRIEALNRRSHDLAVNLDRYLDAARALQTGEYFMQEDATLAMPSYQDVRVVLTAEKDAVTDTCFAVGMKVFKWDDGPALQEEEVFVADTPDGEADMLLDFLCALNPILERVDRENRRVEQNLSGDQPAWKHLDTLHFYAYDTLDLKALRGALERHIFTEDRPELRREIRTLVRLFPPDNVLPDAQTLRTMPGTVVTEVLRRLVALPIPYQYDLRSVSREFAGSANAENDGWTFSPYRPFCWERSNQIAFERIHDVWNETTFEYGGQTMSPDDVLEKIEETARHKLRATESVVRRMQEEFEDRLHLSKEPFFLHEGVEPGDMSALEALETFTLLESSLDELQVKQLHALPVEERAARFECIRGLEYDRSGPGGSHWFTFDPACRDAKFEAGDFALALTHEGRPEELFGIDRRALFDASEQWRYRPHQVTLVEYDMENDPPRVRLAPRAPDDFWGRIDPDETLALDKIHVDYNTEKIQRVLEELRERPDRAPHLRDVIQEGGSYSWTSPVKAVDRVEEALVEEASEAGLSPEQVMNPEQWAAWRGAFQRPLSLVWGPPGTGKTRTLAHALVGAALAAEVRSEPLCVLATAFTHDAVVNVLNQAIALAERYGLEDTAPNVLKIAGYGDHPADARLSDRAELVEATETFRRIRSAEACTIVGGTVWGAHKCAWRSTGSAVVPLFDVALIDEASQMRVPDTLVALATTKPSSNVVLAGDDRQLPPIIHGEYPEEHEAITRSAFAFARHRLSEQGEGSDADLGDAEPALFQLVRNYRMNEPLTAYPRVALYEGRFASNQPDRQLELRKKGVQAPRVVEALAAPERPVVLCRYQPPRSYTGGNPIESELVAAVTDYLARTLINRETGEGYAPAAFAEKGMAALAPHRAQNSAIRKFLRTRGFGTADRPMPLVDTVDKLQGQERDVVLVSYGVADGGYAEGEADFLLSSNRFNVAVTRARRKVIVICSDPVLEVIPSDRETLVDATMLKGFREYCEKGPLQLPWSMSDGTKIPLNIHWKEFGA